MKITSRILSIIFLPVALHAVRGGGAQPVALGWKQQLLNPANLSIAVSATAAAFSGIAFWKATRCLQMARLVPASGNRDLQTTVGRLDGEMADLLQQVGGISGQEGMQGRLAQLEESRGTYVRRGAFQTTLGQLVSKDDLGSLSDQTEVDSRETRRKIAEIWQLIRARVGGISDEEREAMDTAMQDFCEGQLELPALSRRSSADSGLTSEASAPMAGSFAVVDAQESGDSAIGDGADAGCVSGAEIADDE